MVDDQAETIKRRDRFVNELHGHFASHRVKMVSATFERTRPCAAWLVTVQWGGAVQTIRVDVPTSWDPFGDVSRAMVVTRVLMACVEGTSAGTPVTHGWKTPEELAAHHARLPPHGATGDRLAYRLADIVRADREAIAEWIETRKGWHEDTLLDLIGMLRGDS